jgi:hypothetical protein
LGYRCMRVVALLESYWGYPVGALAPRWFSINPDNVTGRNLYKMMPPGADLLCMNVHPYIVASANHHGTPDPLYVAWNLRQLDAPMWGTTRPMIDTLLVCGRIAKETFKRSPYKTYAKILFIKHPAWRAWSNGEFQRVRAEIEATQAGAPN